jgi:WD40 repeat protein
MRRLLLLLLCVAAGIGTHAQTGCPALQAPKPDPSIILTPKQATELGDILAEGMNSRYEVVDDEALTGYLARVGNRVAEQLPPVGLHYTFLLYDEPQVQAFGISGGHIYVSRKLVAFLKSEDELAGVLGHELGHLVAREQDVSTSRLFREILGMHSVPENENLFDRYNQIIELQRTKKMNFSATKEEHGQMTADELGLEGVARAGYAPEAYPDALDRVLQTKGITGNWLSDFFGTTSASSKRLREAMKNLSALPPGCINHSAKGDPQAFAKWQAEVLHYKGIGHGEKVSGVVSRKTLADPLRADITAFRFSADGKYLLAQDNGGIYVLTRDPFQFVFHIEAPDAAPAQFSPDSKMVVFFSSRLRVETWDIQQQIQLNVADVPAIGGCRLTELSPNARYMGCFQENMTVTLFDVASGEKLVEKERFFDFDAGLSGYGGLFKLIYFVTHRDVVTMRFSPDERYFIASSKTGEYVAFDLPGRVPMKVSGQIQTAIKHSFTFIKPDVIVGISEDSPQKSPVVEFPSGKVIDRVPLGETTLNSSENPKYLLLRPIIDHPVGIYDLEKKQVVYSGRNSAMDVWGEELANERLNGEIGLYKTGETKPDHTVTLPLGNLGRLETTVASPDLGWLAISTRTRGAVWDLRKNERSLYIRGFQNASYTAGPAFFFDFPSFEKLPREFEIISPVSKLSRSREVDKDDDLRFFGSTVLRLKTGEKSKGPSEVQAMDIARLNPLWTHNFPKGAPRIGGAPETGKIVFAWKARAPGLHEEMLSDTSLQAHWPRENAADSDIFFQIVNARDGKNSGSVFLGTGKYSFLPEYWNSAGDWLVIWDDNHRVLLYSVSSGEAKQKWFGDRPRLSGSGQTLAFENGAGHLLVYDLKTLKRLNEYYFSAPVSAKMFSEDGKRLLVLLSDQTVFELDLNKGEEGPTRP